MSVHQKASERTPLFYYLILALCGLAIVLAGLVHFGVLKDPFAEKPVPSDWAPPAGYQVAVTDRTHVKYGYKWDAAHSKTCNFGEQCWVLNIVSSRNCKAGFGVSVSYLDSAGVVIRRTHKSVTASANKETQRVFNIYPDKPTKIEIIRAECEVDK